MSATSPSRHLSVRSLSLRPSPLRLPFPPLPSSDRSAVLTASAFVFQPLPHAGQSSYSFCARCRSASPPGTPGTVPPGIFLPGPCRFSLRPSGSRFRRSPAPTVPPSSPLRTFVSQPLPYTGQSTGLYCARCRSASPPGTPGTVPPASFCPAFAPTAPGPCRSPAPAVPPSPPLLPSSSSLSRTPDRVRIRSVRAAVPHHRPALRERSRPTSFCPAFAPPAPASAAPPFSLFPAAAPPLPAATGRTGCSFGPAREKGCLTDLRQPRFYPYCYSGTSPNTQFSENWKNSSDGPLHSYSRSRTSPPPSEHAAQRIEKLAGQLRPLPNRAAGRPPSRPGSGGAQQFIAPQQWIT